MAPSRSITTALVVTWSFLSAVAVESENEANVHSKMIRGSDKRLGLRVDAHDRTSPLDEQHKVGRQLQTGSCSGNNMMCGCQDVRQSDYRGPRSVTQNGFNCKEWSMAENFPGNGLEDGAFCRNPNGVGQKAWCFVEDGSGVMWDYCDVPKCEVESSGSNSDITPGCFNTARYNEIYADIESIKNSIANDVDRSHFLGGIVRLGEW